MKITRTPFDRLFIAGLCLLGFLILGPILMIPMRIPLNYNEGWNAYFGLRAVTADAGPLYPPPGSFVFNNYPPLSFYVVGALGRFVFGDMIVAGRIVALLSLLSSAFLLGFCVRRLGGTMRGSLAAGLLLLLYAGSFFREYVAMNDPQWLAHALMLAGLAVLVRNHAAGRLPVADVVAGALLMVAGAFVKHSLVGLPLAVTAWLAWSDRRALVAWIAAAAIGLGIGLGVTYELHGAAAFADVLHHKRVFHLKRVTKALDRLAPLALMVILGVALLCRRGTQTAEQRSIASFAMVFLAIATVVGIVQRIGEGVYYNAHFETLIAACLALGLAFPANLAVTARWRGRPFGPATLLGLSVLPILVTMPWHFQRPWGDIVDSSAREKSWRPVIAYIAAAPGAAGCEMLSLCYWAGKPFAVDLFNFNQSVLTGGPFGAFQAMVDQRRYGVFQYTPHSFIHTDAVRQQGNDPVIDLLTSRYVPGMTGPLGAVLLVPRTP